MSDKQEDAALSTRTDGAVPAAGGGAAAKLPRLTETMIRDACLSFFKNDNIDGTTIAFKDVDYSFRDAFRRMWTGIRKGLVQAICADAPAESEPVAWRARQHENAPWLLYASESDARTFGGPIVEPLYAAPPPTSGSGEPSEDEQLRIATALTEGDHGPYEEMMGKAFYVDVCRAEHRLKEFVAVGKTLLDALPDHWHDDPVTDFDDLVKETEAILVPGSHHPHFSAEAQREYGAVTIIPTASNQPTEKSGIVKLTSGSGDAVRKAAQALIKAWGKTATVRGEYTNTMCGPAIADLRDALSLSATEWPD